MNSLPSNRKGQGQLRIASLGVIAITLVVAAVILGMGGTILEKIQGIQTDSSATIPNNESLTWTGNNTAIGLAEGRIISGTEQVWNASDLMTAGVDYFMGDGTITFTNDTDAVDWLTDKLNISYSYNYGSEAYNSSNYGMTGVATMAEFIPTIAIVAVAAIIIGILMVFFGRKKEGEE